VRRVIRAAKNVLAQCAPTQVKSAHNVGVLGVAYYAAHHKRKPKINLWLWDTQIKE